MTPISTNAASTNPTTNLLSNSSDGPSNTTTNATITGCLADMLAFASGNSSWLSMPGHITVVNTTFITNYAGTYFTIPQSVFTLCDGWPRARGSLAYRSINTTSVTSTPSTSIMTPYPTEPPKCSLEGSACKEWWVSQSYCYRSSDYHQLTNEAQVAFCAPYLIDSPCASPTSFTIADQRPKTCTSPNMQICQIYAEEMQLHYWPITRQDYDVCNKTGLIVTNNDVSTAIVGTLTVTSPYVALSMPAISAADYCGIIGTIMTDVVVTILPSALSSANGYGNHVLATKYPFNYADLAPNILPASAWFQQQDCISASLHFGHGTNATGTAWMSEFGRSFPECGTIWVDNYQPVLDAPTEIYNLQPGWASCTAAIGLFDPPKALQTAEVAASVTTPEAITLPAATPVQTENLPEQTLVDLPITSTPESPEPSGETSSVVSKDTSETPAAIPVQSTTVLKQTSGDTLIPSAPESPIVSVQVSTAMSSQKMVDISVSAQATQDSVDTEAILISISSEDALETFTSGQVGSQADPASIVATSNVGTPGTTRNAGGIVASVLASSADSIQFDSTRISSSLLGTTGVDSITSGGAIFSIFPSALDLSSDPSQVATQQAVDAESHTSTTAALNLPTQTAEDTAGAQASIVLVSSGDEVVSGSSTFTVETLPQNINVESVSVAGSGVVIETGLSKPLIAITSSIEDTVVYTASEQIFTTVRQSSATTLLAGTSTVTLDIGRPVDPSGVTISALSEGGIVAGGSILPFSGSAPKIPSSIPGVSASAEPDASQAIITGSNIQLATITQQSATNIIQNSGSTASLAVGAQGTSDGHTMSVPSSATGIIVDSTTVQLTASNTIHHESSGASDVSGSTGQPTSTSGGPRNRWHFVWFVVLCLLCWS
ncbi:hypothetical protein LTR56_016696 [Elasticomyces elasticus]|nr:hypothetical protein LTR56_016696 [Elasticomyces elasticus]KAK3663090.1 hypothetical protein LTR22_005999 [Elasticomyces elasticus]KAK4908506.1 hypothetical protein LTR49_022592 [Elasticomyces elasticus]KAK5750608.1 hypothetical protein LTS12_019315 [Elasticomyces elasticus]